MKEKFFPFITGLLVGAIIATTGFLIYSKVTSKTPDMMQMPNGENMGDRPDSMEEPPEKPDGSDKENMPEKPSETNSVN